MFLEYILTDDFCSFPYCLHLPLRVFFTKILVNPFSSLSSSLHCKLLMSYLNQPNLSFKRHSLMYWTRSVFASIREQLRRAFSKTPSIASDSVVTLRSFCSSLEWDPIRRSFSHHQSEIDFLLKVWLLLSVSTLSLRAPGLSELLSEMVWELVCKRIMFFQNAWFFADLIKINKQ